jgi:hypothetical protein
VEHVRILGYGLHKLVKGSVLRMHLQDIAPLLRIWNICTQTETSMPAPNEEQEELDEDLKAVQPFVNVGGFQTPPWVSYGDWLRLMIAHIDAVDILSGYVTGASFQHNTISVQVLIPPQMDRDILPWRELLTDSTLFPQAEADAILRLYLII